MEIPTPDGRMQAEAGPPKKEAPKDRAPASTRVPAVIVGLVLRFRGSNHIVASINLVLRECEFIRLLLFSEGVSA
jgi:hypothetical protein